MLAGRFKVGFSTSLTVTRNPQVCSFWAASLTLQVTGVAPMPKLDPAGGVQVGVSAPSQLSVAVTVKETAVVHCPGSASLVMSGGQLITGGRMSLTLTVNEQLSADGTVQVTVVAPFGNVAPDGGVQVTVPHPPVSVGAS